MADHVFRAAVVDGADRPISGVWQFLSHGDEIDVTNVELAPQFKVSLHSGGRYRLGFTTYEQSERFRPPSLDKAVYKWTPAAFDDTGTRVPFQILIPAAGLGTNCTRRVRSDVQRLPAPEGDQVLILSVVEARSAGLVSNLLDNGTRLLREWSTVGGRHVCIASHLYVPTPAELAQWRHLIASSDAFDRPIERCVDENGEYDLRGWWRLDATEGMCRVMEGGFPELGMWATFTAHAS